MNASICKTFRSLILLAALTLCVPLPAWAAGDSLHFAQIGAGSVPGSIFRTQFRLLNEGSEPLGGSLTLLDASGGVLDLEVAAAWRPVEGTARQEGNRFFFELPVGSSLQLTLTPGQQPRLGWARLETDGACDVQAFFQFARADFIDSLFEEALIREVEILPFEPRRSFSFPISYVNGVQELNTAIALVNLSDAPADVTLTLRPDQAINLRVGAGQLFNTYFDDLVALPAIFGVQVEELAEVTSPAPLGVAVIRTLRGFPLSGVRVAAVTPLEETREVPLGEDFQLALGESVTIEGEPLQVSFHNLPEDSRCPLNVQCVWEGQVRVVLRARLSGASSDNELTLIGNQPIVATAEVGAFRITARQVDPYPDATLPPIEAADYRLTLVVKRTD